jgi:DNA-binding MarR family transcriptional regulator
MLDRIEKASYVRRVCDRAGRRRVLAEPTELARERGREVYAPFAEATKPEFARFCDEQLALVRDFLRAGKDFYGVQTARVERLARTPRLASE